jgi:hypothetical protein
MFPQGAKAGYSCARELLLAEPFFIWSLIIKAFFQPQK